MKISLKVKMSMTLFHAQTMRELRIDKVVGQSYNEEDEGYKQMCNMYRDVIGFDRAKDADKFDEMLMKELANEAQEIEKETIQTIENTIKNCYLKNTSGFVSFGGYLINPKEFCAVRLDGFSMEFSKK